MVLHHRSTTTVKRAKQTAVRDSKSVLLCYLEDFLCFFYFNGIKITQAEHLFKLLRHKVVQKIAGAGSIIHSWKLAISNITSLIRISVWSISKSPKGFFPEPFCDD